MNFGLLISGVVGAIVGALSYFIMSNPTFVPTQVDVGRYLTWFFAAVAVVCFLVALYGCVAESPDAQPATK